MFDVINLHGHTNNNGWYFQQLLKLYAGRVIPNLTNYYLVLDADVFILKPIIFFNLDNHKSLYNYGQQYHQSYFEHMAKLHPSLVKISPDKSGICHHMIFKTSYLTELFKLVRNQLHEPFWQTFLKAVEPELYDGSGSSEYEIYFNFLLKYHKDDIELRQLKWRDSFKMPLPEEDYDYVAIHHYHRDPKFNL